MHGPNFPITKRSSRITVPDVAYPLPKLAFAEMAKQCLTMEELEWRAGVLIDTFKGWRRGVKPSLAAIQAALGALGWELTPVPISPLPAKIAAALAELNAQWAHEEPLLHQLLASACLAPVKLDGLTN